MAGYGGLWEYCSGQRGAVAQGPREIWRTFPGRAAEGKTPYEVLTGTVPSVGHLRVFGCAAYKHIIQGRDGKFGPRAKKLIFVGYVEGMKNYRLFCLLVK